MKEYGYVRVGASVPKMEVANPIFNVKEIKAQIDLAISRQIDILVFPELSITGYTCGDLFHQEILLDKSYDALKQLVLYSKDKDLLFIVGAPIKVSNLLFNTAVVFYRGKILGVVPKTYIPNYNEFYEKRWLSSSNNLLPDEIELCGQKVLFGTDILFEDKKRKHIKFGIEICEDLWCIFPPSNNYVINGATMIFNLSASNEITGKYEYRKDLVKMQSAKTISAYIYTSSGVNESTTDLVFSGASMIYENGSLLKENERFDFGSNLIEADVDIQRLVSERNRNTSYMGITNDLKFRIVYFELSDKKQVLNRIYSKTPFVPDKTELMCNRCNEVLSIQSYALAKRLKHTGFCKTVIGISGGLDSTLAFLVIVRAYEIFGIDNKNIIAVTMPGFGTSDRTYKNAICLVNNYGATLKEISIKEASLLHYKDIGHDISVHDITYENVQARERTQILMDVANKENAIVVGTGDLSELALGWCTYNGDHMSMYSVNASIPKTLVKYLVRFVAINDEKSRKVLFDILDTPISPELLPPSEDDQISQVTEDKIGPYILHDFFLYHFFRYGASPRKILYLANKTFDNMFSNEEIEKWLKLFIKRFFSQQFKRSCVPDGVKVGSVSLSPRGDFRMPSDASSDIWITDLDD